MEKKDNLVHDLLSKYEYYNEEEEDDENENGSQDNLMMQFNKECYVSEATNARHKLRSGMKSPSSKQFFNDIRAYFKNKENLTEEEQKNERERILLNFYLIGYFGRCDHRASNWNEGFKGL